MALLVVAAACSAPVDTGPLDTSGPIVPTVPATTLQPIDTSPTLPDATLPANALFGGDVCTALTATDIASVRLGSFGYGRLFVADAPSTDSCLYRVVKDGVETGVVLKLISPDDFLAPPAANETLTVVDRVGDDAEALVRDGSATVLVRVGDGYFKVSAPDLDSAVALARRAAPRADHPITTTSTTDPGPIPTVSAPPDSAATGG